MLSSTSLLVSAVAIHSANVFAEAASSLSESTLIFTKRELELVKNDTPNAVLTFNPTQSSQLTDDICPNHRFTFECTTESCCESYHQRVLFLLFSLAVFGVAVLVVAVWLVFELWPSRRTRRSLSVTIKKEKRKPSEVELKSNEETKYLRRMSELNPNLRRSVVD